MPEFCIHISSKMIAKFIEYDKLWPKNATTQKILIFFSTLEGRMYEVRLPDGSYVTVDPLLTQVKIISKKSQIGKTLGLCQDSADPKCHSAECLIRTWR